MRNLLGAQSELHERLTMGIRIDHAQPPGAHQQLLAITPPVQQPADLATQGMVIKPRKLQAQIVAVQMRLPFGRTARHPAGKPLYTGYPVLRLARQTREAQLEFLHLPGTALHINTIQQPPWRLHRQTFTDLLQVPGHGKRPLLKLLTERMERQFIAPELPLPLLPPGLPAQRQVSQVEGAGRRISGQVGQGQSRPLAVTNQGQPRRQLGHGPVLTVLLQSQGREIEIDAGIMGLPLFQG